MRFRRSRRPDERTAERLLDTVATGHAERSDDPVARLLAAAVAPARPDELAGEDAALAAFRAARAQRPATGPARPRRTARAAVWLAGFAVAATAGVAVAAVGLDRSDPPPAPPAPTTGVPVPPESAPVPTPTTGSGASTTGSPPGSGHPRSIGPHPPGPAAQRGLCTAYLAKPADQRATSLENPTFRPLVEAAGGPGRVDAYCRGLVTASPGEHPASPGDRPSSPGGHPSSPGGRPTAHQRTSPPADRPSPPR
ncbi:hypothetical protein [Micromonospora inyonensis]|uniref:Uncharacterized protein n=1 Tax=Micromonospora inyonensis TaxID=47866 RepID=A0A1C6SDJ2_9ACTN|nr:hypothetical protein [Micromonospora inyonensis]SCL27527.1 hypothetical protein GA0074694_4838 [Micromonospora inyonensis]